MTDPTPEARGSNHLARRLDALRMRLHYVNRAWTVDDYEALLRFFVRIVPRLMEAERCAVFIVEHDSGRVISKAGTGLGDQIIEAPLEGSLVGQVISTGRARIDNDLATHSGFHTETDRRTGFVTRSIVCAPVRGLAGSTVTGAIQVLNRRGGGGFEATDALALEEIADYLSIALENIAVNREMLAMSADIEREVAGYPASTLAGVPFVAESAAMREVLAMVRMVCETPVSVVIHGENGTGKEVIARMIHAGGERAEQPFVAVNCAAIPETLAESEFFGYERGAFTGAHGARAGRFEEADGGTLFLDEIGELSMSMQPKFLRAIQEREGSRLGSNRIIPYDLGLVSASNRRLSDLVAAGRFREDLYYRLFSVEIVVPPLRARREDIIPLAMVFFDEVTRRYDKALPGLSEEVLALFEAHPWPGNVRQLRREVERLVALTPRGHHVTPERCSAEFHAAAGEPPGPESLDLNARVGALEDELIERALERAAGRKGRAAELLGITRQGLHKKLRRRESG